MKRSSGAESIAFVVKYEAAKGMYKVALETPDSGNFKMVAAKDVKLAPPSAAAATSSAPSVVAVPPSGPVAAGAKVLVTRSSGEETVGFVAKYDAAKDAYMVALGTEDSATSR